MMVNFRSKILPKFRLLCPVLIKYLLRPYLLFIAYFTCRLFLLAYGAWYSNTQSTQACLQFRSVIQPSTFGFPSVQKIRLHPEHNLYSPIISLQPLPHSGQLSLLASPFKISVNNLLNRL